MLMEYRAVVSVRDSGRLAGGFAGLRAETDRRSKKTETDKDLTMRADKMFTHLDKTHSARWGSPLQTA